LSEKLPLLAQLSSARQNARLGLRLMRAQASVEDSISARVGCFAVQSVVLNVESAFLFLALGECLRTLLSLRLVGKKGAEFVVPRVGVEAQILHFPFEAFHSLDQCAVAALEPHAGILAARIENETARKRSGFARQKLENCLKAVGAVRERGSKVARKFRKTLSVAIKTRKNQQTRGESMVGACVFAV
jgi:hypothetical protein